MNKRIRKKTGSLKKSERIELLDFNRITNQWVKDTVKSHFHTVHIVRMACNNVLKNKY